MSLEVIQPVNFVNQPRDLQSENDSILKKTIKKIIALVKKFWNFLMSIFCRSSARTINHSVILPENGRISLTINNDNGFRRIEVDRKAQTEEKEEIDRKAQVEEKEEVERKIQVEEKEEVELSDEEYIQKTVKRNFLIGMEVTYNSKLKEWIREFEEKLIASKSHSSGAILANVNLFKRKTESFFQELREGVPNHQTYSLTSNMRWLLKDQNQEILRTQVEEELACYFDEQEKKVVFEYVDFFLKWVFACKNESIEVEAIKKTLFSKKTELYMLKVREVIFDQLIKNQIDVGIELLHEKRSSLFAEKVVFENTEKIGVFLADRLIALMQKMPFPEMMDKITEMINHKVEEILQSKKDVSKKDTAKKTNTTKKEINTKNEIEAKEHYAKSLQKELGSSCLKIFEAIFPSTWKQQEEGLYEESGVFKIFNILQMSEDHEEVIRFFKEMDGAVIDQNKTNGKSLLHHILLSVTKGFEESILLNITQSIEKSIQMALSKQGINYFSSTILFPYIQTEISKEFIKEILSENTKIFAPYFLSEEPDRLERLCHSLFNVEKIKSTFIFQMGYPNFREISLPLVKELDQLFKNQLKNNKISFKKAPEQVEQYLKEIVKEKENQKENQKKIENKIYWNLFYNIIFKLGKCTTGEWIVKIFKRFISKIILNEVSEVRKDYSKITRLGCEAFSHFYGKREDFEQLIFNERIFPADNQLKENVKSQIHTTAKLLYDFIILKAGFFAPIASKTVNSEEIENIFENIYESLTDVSFLNEDLVIQVQQCIVENFMSSAKALRKEELRI